MTVCFTAGVSAKTYAGQDYECLLELEADSEEELLPLLLAWLEKTSVDLGTVIFDFVRTSIVRCGVLVFTCACEPLELLSYRLRRRYAPVSQAA